MAKKKTKSAKGKARSKKLSVKKRPAKDLDARKGKSVKGGVIAIRSLDQAGVIKLNPNIAAVKFQ